MQVTWIPRRVWDPDYINSLSGSSFFTCFLKVGKLELVLMAEIPNNHLKCANLVNNGITYQTQLVNAWISEPSTVFKGFGQSLSALIILSTIFSMASMPSPTHQRKLKKQTSGTWRDWPWKRSFSKFCIFLSFTGSIPSLKLMLALFWSP